MISKLPINEITSQQIFDTINEIEMTQNGIDKNNQKLKDDNYNLKYSMMLENISDKNKCCRMLQDLRPNLNFKFILLSNKKQIKTCCRESPSSNGVSS